VHDDARHRARVRLLLREHDPQVAACDLRNFDGAVLVAFARRFQFHAADGALVREAPLRIARRPDGLDRSRAIERFRKARQGGRRLGHGDARVRDARTDLVDHESGDRDRRRDDDDRAVRRGKLDAAQADVVRRVGDQQDGVGGRIGGECPIALRVRHDVRGFAVFVHGLIGDRLPGEVEDAAAQTHEALLERSRRRAACRLGRGFARRCVRLTRDQRRAFELIRQFVQHRRRLSGRCDTFLRRFGVLFRPVRPIREPQPDDREQRDEREQDPRRRALSRHLWSPLHDVHFGGNELREPLSHTREQCDDHEKEQD
jgi:hypothetical protein